MRRTWRWFVVPLMLVLAGCASDAELDTTNAQGDVAKDIEKLVVPVFAIAGVILVLICGVVLYVGIKNRVDDYDDDEFPEQIHGNNALEIGWTIAPAAIMAAVAVGTIATHIAINDTEANAMVIEVEGSSTDWEPKVVVVGQQWWWEFRYYLSDDVTADDLRDARNLPEADIVTSGQMAIPVDQEIELLITSRDVIHSFWIPQLNGKRDAAPNRVHPWKLQANDPGVYFGQCTEFCGLSHARMQMQVLAMDDADFQAWIDEQMTPAVAPDGAEAFLEGYRSGESVALPEDASAEARGLEAFTVQCASCHLVDGVNDLNDIDVNQVSKAAPDLTHFAGRTSFAGGILETYNQDGSLNRDDLEAWLRDPSAVKDNASTEDTPRGMPNLQLSERTIDDLVAYLSTLGPLPTDEMIEQSHVD
jgi:cytochrome c oxidase subunit 2